jgi:hypothetical protein
MSQREDARRFVVWDGADAAQRRDWETFWKCWPKREVQAHPGYVSLFANSNCRPLCAAWRTETGGILYPFLSRAMSAEPFCPTTAMHTRDLVTPYGYGGPFCWNLAAGDADEFWSAFTEWARQEDVVSEFIRFNVFPDSLVPYPGAIEVAQNNVVRLVDVDEAALWSDFDHKVSKNVNKARSAGVVVQIEASGCQLDDFVRIYHSTLSRRNAAGEYYFSRPFFEAMHRTLRGQFAYFHARLNEAIVSTELVLVSAENVYSFLGGTDADAFHVRPNDLLKYEIILWARREGKRAFVLGGGYTASDGIFNYKKSFAPAGIVPFRVGYRVLDAKLYHQLLAARSTYARTNGASWEPSTGYFPAYRSQTQTEELEP